MQYLRACFTLVALGATFIAPAAEAAKPRAAPLFTTRPAPYRPLARFTVSYTGLGQYSTRYRSRPPNPGGKPDTNTARDTSTQRWSLTFETLVNFPPCLGGPADPCQAIGTIRGARGRTAVTARISHVHRDGLFKSQNTSIRCQMRATTPGGDPLNATIDLRYNRRRRAIAVQVLNPVADALLLLPSACPGQGDSLDGLYDNYLGPGFSFAPAYGPDRWFTSSAVLIPMRTLHRAAEIHIRVGQTPAGTPPRGCDVPSPLYEHCTTTGSWRGVVTFRALR